MDSYTDGMTLEEQIGQLLMVGFLGDTPSREIIDLIQRYHVGNILLFSRNVRDARQVLELTQSLQMIAREAGQRYPLLIAIDQENGIVQRLGEAVTILPGNMALGAIGTEEMAYKVALATGHELKALGINMNLAPVVDINNNPANPVIGVRSFGEDPQQVARLGAAVVKGYHAAGILSCLKHFPGHGDTAVDSHLALPMIPYTLERLAAVELVPFRSGIEAGTESVMIAHVAFPALTERDSLPATLSPAIVEGLLREQLGFNGVILSDCLEMKAISDTFGTERAAVMALQAGIDLVLVSHHYTRQRGSIEAILRAVRTEELSLHMVQQAAEHVLKLKARYLSWNDVPATRTVPAIIGCEKHVQLQSQAYKQSTTLVRNEDALLPLSLKSGERIVVLSPQRNTMTMVEDRYYSDDLLADILQQYHSPVEIAPVAPGPIEDACKKLLQTTGESDIFIVATVNAHLDEQQAELVRRLVSSERRIIVMAVRNPYDLQAFPQLRTFLVTYEYTRPALVAAVRVLFGEQQVLGHLPVSMPGLLQQR
ncbi:MAG TPA: beta-N-acetylhexosaminidase [Ktedonobacteraceae bacterium]